MIFLYRFDKQGDGLDFVLNEGIAQDMYPDIHENLIPLIESTAHALAPYTIYSKENTIMKFVIHDNGQGEVTFSTGLGQYIDPISKENIFTDAKRIADLCVEVMDRRTLEEKETKKEPNWQPIRNLPMIAKMIDGQLEAAQEQHANLSKAQLKPHVLDDYTVDCVMQVFTEQLDFVPIYKKQLEKWQREERLTSKQRREIKRLQGKIKQWHQVVTDILALADELTEGTIDKVMEKSDLELGIEGLLKKTYK